MADAMSGVGSHAIECYSLSKHYGRGKTKLQVLQNLEMRVPRGKIYGLLGPSGCGKTTLLRCCLGQLAFDQGMVLTLGRPPRTRGHGIPGSRVGYMPQELALYGEFTVKEMLMYFATLHKMRRSVAMQRISFLLNLLNLPFKNTMVGVLSGGQKRRVSFAVALIQSPELLILDEPTVGVDPVLRQKIWEYLIQFAQTGNTTIILTTHYIEEARNAHTVGLMRNGRLLAEEAPLTLIERHNFPTLEEVFLKLCMAVSTEEEEEEEQRAQHNSSHSIIDITTTATTITSTANVNPNERTHLLSETHSLPSPYTNSRSDGGSGCQDVPPVATISKSTTVGKMTPEIPHYEYDTPPLKIADLFPSLMNMSALLIKDLLKLARNPGLTLFQFILPVVEMVLFFLAIGGNLKNLPVAVVNNETPAQLSQVFLDQLDTVMVDQKQVNSTQEAIDNLKQGAYWGVIDIPENFTEELIKRVMMGDKVDNATLLGSTIRVTLDATNQQIAISLQTGIIAAYESFITVVVESLGMNPAVAKIPVVFEEPVYGALDAPFTNFMVAGVLLTIVFFHAVALTSMSFVVERKEGLLDRIWVAGVGPGEITIAHLLTQLLVISVQITVILILTFAAFKLPSEGSLFLVILMMLLQGLGGMALGLLISACCDSESTAIQLSIGTFYPILLLSGIVWPLEAMPLPLYYIAMIFPQTLPAESMRAILGRGWGMSYFEVWIGYVVITVWWLGFMSLAAIVLRIRR